jgi:hypothetical protein
VPKPTPSSTASAEVRTEAFIAHISTNILHPDAISAGLQGLQRVPQDRLPLVLSRPQIAVLVKVFQLHRHNARLMLPLALTTRMGARGTDKNNFFAEGILPELIATLLLHQNEEQLVAELYRVLFNLANHEVMCVSVFLSGVVPIVVSSVHGLASPLLTEEACDVLKQLVRHSSTAHSINTTVIRRWMIERTQILGRCCDWLQKNAPQQPGFPPEACAAAIAAVSALLAFLSESVRDALVAANVLECLLPFVCTSEKAALAVSSLLADGGSPGRFVAANGGTWILWATAHVSSPLICKEPLAALLTTMAFKPVIADHIRSLGGAQAFQPLSTTAAFRAALTQMS